MGSKRSPDQEKLCALIPVYNEETNIHRVVTAVQRYVDTVVVIDDGSCDQTVSCIDTESVIILRHETNKGKGAALQTGFDYALQKGFQAVITLDGDGQHIPSDIPKLIARANLSGAPFVIGSRPRGQGGMPRGRQVVNAFCSALLSFLFHHRLSDVHSGFRYISSSILQQVRLRAHRFDGEMELIVKTAQKGFRIVEVTVQTVYGNELSTIDPLRDTLRFFRITCLAVLWRKGI